MKRLCFLVVLMVLSSSAYAGGSISFTVGGHRVHIESSRHCRSTSCASVSVSGVNERRKRDDDDRELTRAGEAAAACRQPFRHRRRPRSRPPAQTIVAAAAGRLQAGRIAPRRSSPPPPPPPPPAAAAIAVPPPPPPPPVAKPVEAVRPPAPVATGFARRRGRAGRFADRRLADRRQGHGAHRANAATRCAAMCSTHPRTTRARRS